MGFPLLKLAFLAVKQVAKPVASRIKTAPHLKGLMVRIGQALHRNSLQIERASDGKRRLPSWRLSSVAKIDDQSALERGSDFVAELFIYSVSASIVGAEFFMCAASHCV